MMAQRVLFGGDYSGDERRQSERIDEMNRLERRMKMRYGKIKKFDKGVPHPCDCSAAIHIATSSDPNTRGKLYFSCPYEISDGPSQGCGFRRWWIETLCDEFANIKEEKNEMKNDMDVAKKRIEDHKVTIFEMELQLGEIMEDKQKQVEEKIEMKKDLDIENKRNEDHEGTIFKMEFQLDEIMKDKQKQVENNRGDHFDTGMGVVYLMEKLEALEKKYEALDKKYESLNKYL